MPDWPEQARAAAIEAVDKRAPSITVQETWQLVTDVLDAAAPILAEAVAQKILAEKVDCPEHPMPFPKPSCWTCGRNGAFHRAARIAAGVHGAEKEDAPALPTAAQIRTWLAAHGWTAGQPGPAGALWTPPGDGQPVGVPHDDEDTGLTAAAIKRIANREGRPVDEVTREMLAVVVDGDG